MTELAWAAGFYDGEGSLAVDRKYEKPAMNIQQVDRRSLSRFAKALGVGRVGGPHRRRNRPNAKPFYQLSFRSRKAERVIRLLWPWLGPAKREQAIRVYDAVSPSDFHPRLLPA